jgi:hypothetical protein
MQGRAILFLVYLFIFPCVSLSHSPMNCNLTRACSVYLLRVDNANYCLVWGGSWVGIGGPRFESQPLRAPLGGGGLVAEQPTSLYSAVTVSSPQIYIPRWTGSQDGWKLSVGLREGTFIRQVLCTQIVQCPFWGVNKVSPFTHMLFPPANSTSS